MVERIGRLRVEPADEARQATRTTLRLARVTYMVLPSLITVRDSFGVHQRLPILAPGVIASLQGLGIKALMPKACGNRLAWCPAGLANRDHRSTLVSPAPTGHVRGRVMLDRGEDTWIGSIFFLCVQVDECRRIRQPDETGELRNGDFGGRRHGGVHLESGHGRDLSAEASRANRGGPRDTSPPQPCRNVNCRMQACVTSPFPGAGYPSCRGCIEMARTLLLAGSPTAISGRIGRNVQC